MNFSVPLISISVIITLFNASDEYFLPYAMNTLNRRTNKEKEIEI